MRLFRAGLIASVALTAPALVLAQSSSPFSGLFGGGSEADGPVKLDVTVADGDDALTRQVRNTSLIAAALGEDRTTGQDVLAAARADYARILGLMYDEGYYSAIINITLDGVEAAEIAPLDAPEIVSNVVVALDPGPRFTFSRAEIAPVAPGSEIPEEYAVGKPAAPARSNRRRWPVWMDGAITAMPRQMWARRISSPTIIRTRWTAASAWRPARQLPLAS